MSRPARIPTGRVLVLACLAAALLLPAGASAQRRATRAAAKPRATALTDSNRVLVRVGAETITRGDVQRRIEQLPEQFRSNYATPEGRQQLLDRMVEEKVWLQMAGKAGVASRPDVKQQLEQQRRDLLIRTYLNEVMAANPAVPDSEAQAWYQEHLEDYRVPATLTVRHILLKKEGDAKNVLRLARAPRADWDALVKRWSADTLTKQSGGSLGTVTREGQFASIGVQPALAESAFTLAVGQVGGPWKSERGWHVVKVDNLRPESVRPFDQVRQLITRQLGSQRSQEFYKDRLEQARRSLNVRPDSTAIDAFVSQKKTPREQFNEAQALASPQARIEAYEKLLREHPDSDVSPQAQFMVGFIRSEELKDYEGAEAAFRALLARYPKAELAASAQWMLEHMRSEEPPAFIQLDAEGAEPAKPSPSGSAADKP
jgi:peptidyl-prolyl cis-trans isomerase C